MTYYKKVVYSIVIFIVAVIWTSAAKPLNYENISKDVVFEHQNDTDTVTIVAFGNSITATRKTINKVFAQRLPGLLLENGIKTRVINSGIGGSHTGRQSDHNLFKIKHALDRFDSDVIAHNPDVVLIGFGTNDAHIDSKVRGGKSRIPLDKYKDNLEYMINRLLEQNSGIILIAPNILGAKYGDVQNDRLIQYVKVVRHLARKYKLGLVDNYKLFIKFQRKSGESYDSLMLDGVHPNDRGHELIAGELVKEVLKILKN